MDYLLNRQVQLSEESDCWSLKEFDANGIQIGEDQVPTTHSITFHARELYFSSNLQAESNTETHTNEEISAKLHRGLVRSDETLEPWYPELSMFGTDRYIKSFTLWIKKLDDDLKPEYCEMAGVLAYEDDDDYTGSYKQDDWIGIYLYLTPKQFDNLAESIRSQNIYSINISLSASGTYVERNNHLPCGPDTLKILLDTAEQKVIIPEGSLIKPEVVGNVNSFKLSIQECGRIFPERALKPIDNIDESSDDNDDTKDFNVQLSKDVLHNNMLLLDQIIHTESALKNLNELIDNQFKKNDLNQEEYLDKNEPDVNALLLAQLIRNETTLKKLRTPLWLIFILLLSLALKIVL